MYKEDHFYLVIESIVDNNGNFGELHNYYEAENLAYAKYYTILSAAAVSAIPFHAAYIIRDDGVTTEGRIFDRRPNTPAPEPEPEPEEEQEEEPEEEPEEDNGGVE